MTFTPFNNFPFNVYSDTLRCIKNGLYCGQEELAKYIRKVGTFNRPIPFSTTLSRKETYFAAMQLNPDFLHVTVFFLLGTILTTSLESCMNTNSKDRSYSCDFQIQFCSHVWPLPHSSSLGGRTVRSDSQYSLRRRNRANSLSCSGSKGSNCFPKEAINCSNSLTVRLHMYARVRR